MTRNSKKVNKYIGAEEPVLVILMRNDLDSLNPGKACAQASHASNQMVKVVSTYGPYWKASLDRWSNEADGFGTCIVRAGSWYEIEKCLKEWDFENVIKGKVLDPSYPLKDGVIIHEFPLHTCAWLFSDRPALREVQNYFELMK